MENFFGNAIDFVGDIHGNAYKLKKLLARLGYQKNETGWFHPESRKLIILGDFINVGFESKEVLSILKELWNDKVALILVGNHEYFLVWNYYKSGSRVLRPGSQLGEDYSRFLEEFDGDEKLLIGYCEWIYTMPIYLEGENFRAVHAYWSKKNEKSLLKHKNLKEFWEEFDEEKKKKSKKLKLVINETLSGKMAVFFAPGRMEKPLEFRIKWWKNLYGKNLSQGIHANRTVKYPAITIDSNILPDFEPYPETEKPIFFGHYWFQTLPYLVKNNVCCLDFGATKGGYLTAYRWNGERKLDANNLIWV
jgi:hypothetical protein